MIKFPSFKSPNEVTDYYHLRLTFLNEALLPASIKFLFTLVLGGQTPDTSGILLEKGNVVDSACLLPLVKLHVENTGIIPDFISADDGYSSGAGREACLEFGVRDICLSGAVGKKITPDELWESDEYTLGRRKRSAVESLMFTLKYVFEFGRLRRRGLENVRAEMTEEVIAYNIRKKILLQEQLNKENEFATIRKSA